VRHSGNDKGGQWYKACCNEADWLFRLLLVENHEATGMLVMNAKWLERETVAALSAFRTS